jgi:hypothetical protein
VLNHLNTGTIVERARILRDKFALKLSPLKRFISVSSIVMTGAGMCSGNQSSQHVGQAQQPL